MFKFNSKSKPEPEEQYSAKKRGVRGQGNSLYIASLMAMLILLLPTVAAWSYLTLVREPAQVELQLKSVASSYASQQATSVHHLLNSLRSRIRGAARSSQALSALAMQSGQDLALVEKSLLNHFPEAISLRVVPLGKLGTARLEGGIQGLRNHIEVDLVRRASAGESTWPEAYRFENRWLVSLAEPITDPSIADRRAVLVVSLDNRHFSALLAALDPSAGKFSLEQVYQGAAGARTDVIASSGSGDEQQYTQTAAIPDSSWQVRFTPSFHLTAALTTDTSSLYAALATATLGALAALVTMLALYRRRLRKEVRKIISASHAGKGVTVRIPELIPLAKHLHRPSAAPRSPETPEAGEQSADSVGQQKTRRVLSGPASWEPPNPMYQRDSFIVEEEVLELDLEEEDPQVQPDLAAEADRGQADGEENGAALTEADVVRTPELEPPPRPGAEQQTPADSEPRPEQMNPEPTACNEIPAPVPLPEHIFRAYDIRGKADEELTDELVSGIGGAIGTMAGELGQQTLIVGCDGRNSSPRIKAALIAALQATGRDVIDIGLVPTPLLYFATRHLNCGSGVMITGSHNPADCNGLKIVLNQQTIAAGGIQQLRQRVVEGNFASGSGRVTEEDVAQAYIDELMADLAIAEPLKLVIDAGNGATAEIAPRLFEELGCEVIAMNCTVDGDFPGHPPDTSNEDNLRDLAATVCAQGADLGIAFDGDGDRLAAVTASGRIVRADQLMMIYARDVVTRNPGSEVVFDVKCSRQLGQVITQCGGQPILWKTGHAFMKEKMRESGALLGGEFSGHIFFGERWYGFDDGMYAAGRLAEIISIQGLSLEDLLEAFPRTCNTPEIRIPVPEQEKFQLMERLVNKASFSAGRVNTMDGIRVDFPEGWGLLRASNTAPALTARFEASSEAEMERIMGEFRLLLEEAAPGLEPCF